MKKIAILQSNYIPWKGYFDIIGLVDEFILYDDMQYTRRDWRNRNKIKTPQGLQWLTIPVDTKGKYLQKINETRVVDHEWAFKHLKAIRLNYSHAPYYEKYEPVLADLYEKASSLDYLSEINYLFSPGSAVFSVSARRSHGPPITPWSPAKPSVWPGLSSRREGIIISPGRPQKTTLSTKYLRTRASSSPIWITKDIRSIRSCTGITSVRSASSICS